MTDLVDMALIASFSTIEGEALGLRVAARSPKPCSISAHCSFVARIRKSERWKRSRLRGRSRTTMWCNASATGWMPEVASSGLTARLCTVK